uniref:Uncharacterized protein n=1 Tax=Arundo donax TaxID=35708 RepID=A0A0A9H2T6_ARUDO
MLVLEGKQKLFELFMQIKID